jgi:hypothetical protein
MRSRLRIALVLAETGAAAAEQVSRLEPKVTRARNRPGPL